MEIYLDNAATTRVSPEAAEAALRVMREEYGNPGSTHAKGRSARAVLDAARKQVAGPLRCRPAEIVFTSGGTESDNWAIRGAARLRARTGRHIISSRTEHDAVRRTLEYLERRAGRSRPWLPDRTAPYRRRRWPRPCGRIPRS